MTTLRFAPIISVSTEAQKKKGESLSLQTTQIKQYVESLGGVIPDNCWKYKGQENVTLDHERALLDQLLEDSAKEFFDTVIVCDASHWSSDNLRNEIGLRTLRDNNIRFFTGTTEHDFQDNTQFMYLQHAAIIIE
jgi:hypothetical protein